MRARLLVLGPASVPSLRRAACASNLHALTTFKAFKAPLSASSANALATTRAPASLPVPCIALSTRPTTLLPLQRLLAFPRREMGTKYKVPKMKPRQAQPSVPKLEEPVQTKKKGLVRSIVYLFTATEIGAAVVVFSMLSFFAFELISWDKMSGTIRQVPANVANALLGGGASDEATDETEEERGMVYFTQAAEQAKKGDNAGGTLQAALESPAATNASAGRVGSGGSGKKRYLAVRNGAKLVDDAAQIGPKIPPHLLTPAT